jgi:hypothetical protein
VPVLPLDKVIAKEKARGEELSAIGKQTMAHAYSAMDYYSDHLKKTVASAPSGGTEFGEKVKACAEQNIAATQEFVGDLSYAKDNQDVSNSDGIYANANGGVRETSQQSWRGLYQNGVKSNELAASLKACPKT